MFRFDRTNITVKNIWISFFKNLECMDVFQATALSVEEIEEL